MNQYFDTPIGPAQHRQITARIWGREHTFVTAAGVFSGFRLDPGTAVLFDKATPASTASTLLDLGCGYGPITVALANKLPEAFVYAIDVNERALELAQSNVALAGVAQRVQVSFPVAVPSDISFDEIWSNPPIRVGKEALHTLLLTWLPRLTPHGSAYLVVGKNLGADSLHSWLVVQGYFVERLGSAKGFRVLRVNKGLE
ncbi:MAG: methyltransferase [Propionibacteriaceae bacterium]|jgi:16S rRNA G1207 methylase RsmC|nr:methyltransferase [Propionibacteriaceae bacterium]